MQDYAHGVIHGDIKPFILAVIALAVAYLYNRTAKHV